jgi:hypothetical protein
MARSHVIWVVISELYPWPMAAFTVKHELKGWLKAQDPEKLSWMHVWRCENANATGGGRERIPNRPTPKPEELDIREVMK